MLMNFFLCFAIALIPKAGANIKPFFLSHNAFWKKNKIIFLYPFFNRFLWTSSKIYNFRCTVLEGANIDPFLNPPNFFIAFFVVYFLNLYY